ncbi:hypothetical protein CRE_17156 [Caenorhabditis remanei]|uniref:Uncharacterized protein n=1 Tax=Caenorhabditis remanei TaxID=31234 RepID=E3MAF4_CAERE|nr:hypothetical protein CRE_17156 [Caenorhabditis remanei]
MEWPFRRPRGKSGYAVREKKEKPAPKRPSAAAPFPAKNYAHIGEGRGSQGRPPFGRNWFFPEPNPILGTIFGHSNNTEDNFWAFISASEWPESSPDLYPLGYSAWGYLILIVSTKNYANLNSLKAALLKAWDDLDVNYLRAVVDDYPKRLRARHLSHPVEIWQAPGPSDLDLRRADDWSDFEKGNPSHLIALKREAEERAALQLQPSCSNALSMVHPESLLTGQNQDKAAPANSISRSVPTTGGSFRSVKPYDIFDDQDVIIIESPASVTNVPATAPSDETSIAHSLVDSTKPGTSAPDKLTATECPPAKKLKKSSSFSGCPSAGSESHLTYPGRPTTSSGATVLPPVETWLQRIKNRENSSPLTLTPSRPNSNGTASGTQNTDSDSTGIKSVSVLHERTRDIPPPKRKNRNRNASRKSVSIKPMSWLNDCQCPRRKKRRRRYALGKEPEGLLTNFEEVFKMGNEGELQQLLIALSTKIHHVMYTDEGKKEKARLIEDLSKILGRSREEAASEAAEKVVPEITIDEEMDESTIDFGPWEEDWKCKTPTNRRVPYSEFGEDDWERIRKEVRYGESGRPVQAEASRQGLAYKYAASYQCLETVPEKIDEITEKFTRPYRSIKVSYKIQQGFYSGVELETASIASITFTLKKTPTVSIRFSENLPSQSFELRLFKEVSLVPPLCLGFPSCLILTPIKNAEGMIFRQMEKLSPRFKELKAVMRIGDIPMTVSKPLFFVLKSAPLEPETECTFNVRSDSRFSSQISAVAGFIIMTSNFPLHAKRLKMNYLTDNTFWDDISSMGLVWVFLSPQGGPRGWRVMSRDSIPVRCTSNFVEWPEKPNRIYPLYPPIHPFRPLQIEPNLNWNDSFNPGKPFPSIPATSVLLPDISMLNCDGSGPSTSRPPRADGDSANEDSTPQPPETSPELPSPDFFSVPRREENGKTRKHLNTINGEKDAVAMNLPEMSSSEVQRSDYLASNVIVFNRLRKIPPLPSFFVPLDSFPSSFPS